VRKLDPAKCEEVIKEIQELYQNAHIEYVLEKSENLDPTCIKLVFTDRCAALGNAIKNTWEISKTFTLWVSPFPQFKQTSWKMGTKKAKLTYFSALCKTQSTLEFNFIEKKLCELIKTKYTVPIAMKILEKLDDIVSCRNQWGYAFIGPRLFWRSAQRSESSNALLKRKIRRGFEKPIILAFFQMKEEQEIHKS